MIKNQYYHCYIKTSSLRCYPVFAISYTKTILDTDIYENLELGIRFDVDKLIMIGGL